MGPKYKGMATQQSGLCTDTRPVDELKLYMGGRWLRLKGYWPRLRDVPSNREDIQFN